MRVYKRHCRLHIIKSWCSRAGFFSWSLQKSFFPVLYKPRYTAGDSLHQNRTTIVPFWRARFADSASADCRHLIARSLIAQKNRQTVHCQGSITTCSSNTQKWHQKLNPSAAITSQTNLTECSWINQDRSALETARLGKKTIYLGLFCQKSSCASFTNFQMWGHIEYLPKQVICQNQPSAMLPHGPALSANTTSLMESLFPEQIGVK